MTKITDLQAYIYHYFQDDNDDEIYKAFEEKYIDFIQSLADKNKWEVKSVYKNNFHFGICITSNKAILVISIYDVRKEYLEWYDRVHIKVLKNNKEMLGRKTLHYTAPLPKLEMVINKLTNNKTGDEINIDDIF